MFCQPLWQTDMARDTLKQELFQGMIIGKKKLNKAFVLRVSLYASPGLSFLNVRWASSPSLFGWYLNRGDR